MDTYMSLRAWGATEELLAEAQERVEALEGELSATREGSAVFTLNREGRAAFSPEGAAVLSRALELCALTEGTLDISVYPVIRAWGFTAEEYRVPEAAELTELLRKVDYRRVSVDGDGNVSVPEGVEIDLGSVTKGYTGDMLCSFLREKGVKSALLDLGGNVQALGAKPDGTPWRVGIRDPEGEGLLGVLSVEDEAVITSGGYERYFVDEDGNLWWHIIDPADGYPARNGLVSATAVGREGAYCDALSTTLFILGPERAVEFWRQRGDFDMLLVTEDGRLLLTPGLGERFAPAEGQSYTMELIAE